MKNGKGERGFSVSLRIMFPASKCAYEFVVTAFVKFCYDDFIVFRGGGGFV